MCGSLDATFGLSIVDMAHVNAFKRKCADVVNFYAP